MRSPRRWAGRAGPITGILFFLLTILAPAAAASPDTGLSVVTKTSTAAERAAARAYWTPERMRAAALNDVSTVAGSSGRAESKAGPAPSLAEPRALATPAYSASANASVNNLTAPITHGRLFFYTIDNPPGHQPQPNDQSCSASVVNSGVKNTIVTAAHCAYSFVNEYGGWNKGFIFVPMYWDGQAPFGIWDYSRVSLLSDWMQWPPNLGHDYAILNMMDNNGHKLADVVGANGLYVNLNPTQTVVIWGYPGSEMRPYYCDQVRTSAFPQRTIFAGCNTVKGMSGGPWLVQYNYDIQLGYINGTTSRGENDGTISSYFDDDMAVLYEFATSA